MNATKERFGATDLPALFTGATKVLVAKGKNVTVLDLSKADDAERLADLALGPTGNLRAPAIRMGKTWLIGFHEETYRARFD